MELQDRTFRQQAAPGIMRADSSRYDESRVVPGMMTAGSSRYDDTRQFWV